MSFYFVDIYKIKQGHSILPTFLFSFLYSEEEEEETYVASGFWDSHRIIGWFALSSCDILCVTLLQHKTHSHRSLEEICKWKGRALHCLRWFWNAQGRFKIHKTRARSSVWRLQQYHRLLCKQSGLQRNDRRRDWDCGDLSLL